MFMETGHQLLQRCELNACRLCFRIVIMNHVVRSLIQSLIGDDCSEEVRLDQRCNRDILGSRAFIVFSEHRKLSRNKYTTV